jgi:hypothetical protein
MLRITRSAELSAGLGSRANRGAQRCKERNCFRCLRLKVRRPRFLTIRATFPPALSVAFLFASQPEPLRYFCPISFRLTAVQTSNIHIRYKLHHPTTTYLREADLYTMARGNERDEARKKSQAKLAAQVG